MPRKALIVKAKKIPKYEVRKINRCSECGRSRSFRREYELCRIHLREYAYKGLLPGVKKASW